MSKKQVFYIIFFGVLVVGFFFTLSHFIPDFTKVKINPIGQVEPFTFTSQSGKTVTEKDIQGKVTVVNFFFTTCKSICPRMNGNLKPVYNEFKNEPDLIILSHTVDPERDSVGRLKQYADSMQVDQNKWVFLTGRKDSLYSTARHSYKLDDPNNYVDNINDDFLHTQFVALVNKKGEVVHIYDGIKQSEIREMSERIKTLLKE
jgi:protein SCO1/2